MPERGFRVKRTYELIGISRLLYCYWLILLTKAGVDLSEPDIDKFLEPLRRFHYPLKNSSVFASVVNFLASISFTLTAFAFRVFWLDLA
jgi:hypothetical protein